MKIKKNDNVIILSGKDKGKQGKILRVFPDREKVMVEGLNLMTKHVRPRKQGERGERVELPRAVFTGKVQVVCPKCSKPTRVGWQIEGDKKERVCKKCLRTF